MRYGARRLLPLIGIAALTACGHARTTQQPNGDVVPDTKSQGGATIITSAVLQQASRPLLDVLQARLPYMQVVPTGSCPEVYLRGRSTVFTPSNPAIYVDGQKATNTCVLQMLDTADLDHVEVYPNGQPRRPEYPSDPYGVILIFAKTQ